MLYWFVASTLCSGCYFMDMIKSEYAVVNPGEGTLFLDQTEAQRAQKNFWRPPPPIRIG